MFEIVFLSVLALIWVIAATIQDNKTTEIANWLNFSLAIFAIGFRLFYSIFSNDFSFLYQGLIGLAIFFVMGNLFYKARMFAGGDAKLFISLGAVLPIYSSLYENLNAFLFFLLIFLGAGALYSIASSVVLCFNQWKDFRKEFVRQFGYRRRVINTSYGSAATLILFALFFDAVFLYLAAMALIIPYLYIYAKAVDEAAMVRRVSAKNLMEGDWLYKDVRVGKTLIRANWDGLTKHQIGLLRRKNKEVLIRRGIPFANVFLLSVLFYFYFYFIDLRYAFW